MPALSIIPSRALQDPELTGSRLRALCAIGTFTSREGKGVWAANATLAEMAHMDERAFRREAAWLVDRGYVRKKRRFKRDGSQDTNLLQIVLDEPEGAVAVAGEPEGGEGEIHPPGGRAESTHPPRAESAQGGRAESTHQTSPLQKPATPARAREGEEPPTAPIGLEREFAHDAHREAYLAIRRGMQHPDGFDAALRSVHSPITGGASFGWDAIGAALLEVRGNGESFNVSRFRGYCRRHVQGPADGSGSAVRPLVSKASLGGIPANSLQDLWALLVDGGFTAPMQTPETIAARAAAMVSSQRVPASAAQPLVALVAHLRPWELAEMRFEKAREERLSALVTEFIRRAA
jgi:hypothetical protein